MSEHEKEEQSKVLPGEPVIADHVYDGIRELNNPLPGWWLGTFYITIVFAIGYFFYYSFGPGVDLNVEFEQTVAQAEKARAANPQTPQGPTEAQLNAAIADVTVRQKGKGLFDSKCVACHGPQGQGSIGPNLTDNFWIHGSKPLQITQVIQEGVLDKGMPPWKSLLQESELVAVVSYVKSLQGTHPANPKAPQGTEEK